MTRWEIYMCSHSAPVERDRNLQVTLGNGPVSEYSSLPGSGTNIASLRLLRSRQGSQRSWPRFRWCH